MAWILDEYSKFHGHSPAIVTGKPVVRKRTLPPLYWLWIVHRFIREGVNTSDRDRDRIGSDRIGIGIGSIMIAIGSDRIAIAIGSVVFV
jgi:hypothetical protein